MRSPRVLLFAAIAFTVLAWASAFVVIRGVGVHLDGGPLALARLAVGAVALGVLAALTRAWVRPTAREWGLLALYGVAWFGAYNVALNTAEQTLDAGTAAMIVNIGPLLIALGAGAFLGEGIPRWLAVGSAVAFAGVVLIGVSTSLGDASAPAFDLVGALLAVVAAVTYAVGVLAQKPLVRRIPAVQVTFLGCVAGLLACLPFAGETVAQLAVAPPDAWLGTIYLGVVPTALAFTTWAYALQRMPAGRLGVTTYLVPPLAIVLGLIAFGEVPHWLALVGGALCLGGVALSRRQPVVREQARAVGPE